MVQRRQWQPTPVLLPGKSQGWRSVVGYSPWGHKELDMTERLHFLSFSSRVYSLSLPWSFTHIPWSPFWNSPSSTGLQSLFVLGWLLMFFYRSRPLKFLKFASLTNSEFMLSTHSPCPHVVPPAWNIPSSDLLIAFGLAFSLPENFKRQSCTGRDQV